MSQVIKVPGGLITLVDTDFKCPRCTKLHHEDDWYPRVNKSKHGVIYMRCKGCKVSLGVTTDIKGDVVVWLKSEESKNG